MEESIFILFSYSLRNMFRLINFPCHWELSAPINIIILSFHFLNFRLFQSVLVVKISIQDIKINGKTKNDFFSQTIKSLKLIWF